MFHGGEYQLANLKSAKKRIKVTEKKTLRNKRIKTQTKNAIKKVHLAIENGNKQEAEEAYQVAMKVIDKAAAKGIYHKNAAARKKSTLARLINKVSA